MLRRIGPQVERTTNLVDRAALAVAHQERGPLLRAERLQRFLDAAADFAGIDEVVGRRRRAAPGELLETVVGLGRLSMRPGPHVVDGAVEPDPVEPGPEVRPLLESPELPM